MTDALKDEFPDPETELAFLDFLATEWPNWRHHVGSDHWHIRRRSFLAGRPAPQALAATPAVDGEARDANALARHIGECLKHHPSISEVLSLNFTVTEWHELQKAVAERNSERVKNAALAAMVQPAAVGSEAISRQPEYDALYDFDSENNIEPASVVAERIASKYGFHDKHPVVDDIHYAIEDALELGQRRGRLIPPLAAQPASPLRGREPVNLTDEVVDASLSEYWDVSPRAWNETQRVGMRKAILTALGISLSSLKREPCPGCDGYECDDGCQYPGAIQLTDGGRS